MIFPFWRAPEKAGKNSVPLQKGKGMETKGAFHAKVDKQVSREGGRELLRGRGADPAPVRGRIAGRSIDSRPGWLQFSFLLHSVLVYDLPFCGQVSFIVKGVMAPCYAPYRVLGSTSHNVYLAGSTCSGNTKCYQNEFREMVCPPKGSP